MIADVVLNGTSVRLRPVREADLPHFQRWLNDPEVYQWLHRGTMRPVSWQDELAWWEAVQSSENQLVWSIETAEGRLLGDISLHWSPANRRAELGIFIGEKDEWDKGYGTEAVQMLAGYTFGELELNRLGLNCDATNRRAMRCYEKVGFRHEGVMRENRHVDGQFRDSLVMGLLKREWSDG